eukprot:gene25447-11110_t
MRRPAAPQVACSPSVGQAQVVVSPSGGRPQAVVSPGGRQPQVGGSPSGGRPQVVVSPGGRQPQEVVSPSGGRPQAVVSPGGRQPQVVVSPSGGRPQVVVSPSGQQPQQGGSPSGRLPQVVGSPYGGRPHSPPTQTLRHDRDMILVQPHHMLEGLMMCPPTNELSPQVFHTFKDGNLQYHGMTASQIVNEILPHLAVCGGEHTDEATWKLLQQLGFPPYMFDCERTALSQRLRAVHDKIVAKYKGKTWEKYNSRIRDMVKDMAENMDLYTPLTPQPLLDGSHSPKIVFKIVRTHVEFTFALCSYERGFQLRNAPAVGVGLIEYPPDPSFLISFQSLEALTMGKFKFKEAVGDKTTVSTFPRHCNVWECPVFAYMIYTIVDLCMMKGSAGQPRLLRSWIKPGPKKDHYAHMMLHSSNPDKQIKAATHNDDIRGLHEGMESSHGQTTHMTRGSGVTRDTIQKGQTRDESQTKVSKTAGYLARKQVAIWRSVLMPGDFDPNKMLKGADVAKRWQEMQANWPLQEAEELWNEIKKMNKDLANQSCAVFKKDGDSMTEDYLEMLCILIKRCLFQVHLENLNTYGFDAAVQYTKASLKKAMSIKTSGDFQVLTGCGLGQMLDQAIGLTRDELQQSNKDFLATHEMLQQQLQQIQGEGSPDDTVVMQQMCKHYGIDYEQLQPSGAQTQSGGAQTQPSGAQTQPGGAQTQPSGAKQINPASQPLALSPKSKFMFSALNVLLRQSRYLGPIAQQVQHLNQDTGRGFLLVEQQMNNQHAAQMQHMSLFSAAAASAPSGLQMPSAPSGLQMPIVGDEEEDEALRMRGERSRYAAKRRRMNEAACYVIPDGEPGGVEA